MQTTSHAAHQPQDIQELKAEQLDAVGGGIAPLIAGIILGELFALGFVGGMIAHDVMYPAPRFRR